jgi:biopolymer transport protein ExbB
MHPTSLLIAALVMLRRPCARNQATASLLLGRAINQDTARLEYGHTMLASIASSAPFVGLFGTVWGIYHALVNIGMIGSGSLDQVAGPVGEALIMTALGLAVAIPAVLAYNFFNRSKRQMLSEVDGFAHDLFAFMSTGVRNNTHIEKDAAQVYTAPVARSA